MNPRQQLDLTKIDLNKIENPKLREVLEKAAQDKKEGRPYQRPVFNPFLYFKPEKSISETVLVSKTESVAVAPVQQAQYLNASKKTFEPVYTFEVSTSVIVALMLVSSLSTITIQVHEPSDVAKFRITDNNVVQHIQNSIALSNTLQDPYSKLSVLPMSLSVDVTFSGTKKDLLAWANEQRNNTFLQVEIQQVTESIKTILNDVA